MWFVSNSVNTPILLRYNERVIKSFFELWISLSKRPLIISELEQTDYLKTQLDSDSFLDSRILTINRSSRDTIIPLIKEIIKLGTTVLEEEYDIFISQNENINNLNFNLNQLAHPSPLSKIFKDYFYDKFFGVDWIWTDIIGQDYNRGKFHSQFKTENKIAICPYCDIDSITEQRNSWVEHFLPKSKFPYIACNPKNILPSCTSCNVSGSGKGENVRIPISTPYNKQIGDLCSMNLIDGEIEIDTHSDTEIENYIELLKLRTRYKEPLVSYGVFSSLTNNYNLALELSKSHDFDKDTFLEYLQKNGRINGFYFVQKKLLGNIDDIRLMDL
jgi:hypothetical protein